MGAWGYKNSENDTASDWLAEFFDEPKIEKIEDIFSYILEQEEFLDYDESCIGLIAAEILLSKRNSNYKFDIYEDYDINLIDLAISDDLINKAMQVIEKILYFEGDSELKELWEETDDYDNWLKKQISILENLRRLLPTY